MSRPASSTRQGDGLRRVLSTVYTVSAFVFLLLAVLVVLGIVFTITPANPDNTIVRHSLDAARTVAGPFKDLFTVKDPDKSIYANYTVAAVVYIAAALLVTRLPGRR